jgi:hypothetical protein
MLLALGEHRIGESLSRQIRASDCANDLIVAVDNRKKSKPQASENVVGPLEFSIGIQSSWKKNVKVRKCWR